MTILVLDIGSSSARALLFDGAARPIDGAETTRTYTFVTEPTGAAIFDAETLRAAVEACIDALLLHPAAREIEAVGMATFVGNVVGIDAGGAPITPVYLYADTRSAADVIALRDQYDEAAAHDRTGCRIASAYLPARFAWLKRTDPATFDRAAQWLDFGTYLYRCWAGNQVPMSPSSAAWSGLLRRDALAWDAEWLGALGTAPERLPELALADDAHMTLAGGYAARWRALAGVPFFLAVGDGAAANIGAGCAEPSRIALSVGTTAALRVVSATMPAHLPGSLWNYRVSWREHLIGGATSEGGGVFHWLRGVLALPDDLERALAARPRAAHGLTMLPLLAGERSPGFRADAVGTLHGLRLSTDAVDIMAAALEGVALRLRLILNDLSAFAVPSAPIMAGGGALASGVFAQIVADALDRPIHVLAEREITARGVALLALRSLIALGAAEAERVFPDPAVARAVLPHADGVQALAAALARQQDMYRRLYPSPADSTQ